MAKYRVTQKKVFRPKRNADGAMVETEVPVNEIIEIEGKLPAFLIGKVRAEAVAVTNPAEGALPGPEALISASGSTAGSSAAERQSILAEVAVTLDDSAFTANGSPATADINDMLVEGVPHFTAQERDSLWPGIADAVRARREAAGE